MWAPFADFGPIKVPDEPSDERVVFLTDIFPTGYMDAVNGDVLPGYGVAVWACGPVGHFSMRSASVKRPLAHCRGGLAG